MKLRTQFLLGVAILVVVLLCMGGFAVYTTLHVQGLKSQQAIANALEREANDLSYISNNYILYHEVTQVSQWQSVFSSFRANLAGLDLDRPEEAALVASIKTNADRVEVVFRQIVSAVETAGSPGVVSSPDFLQMSWSRVEVQNRQIVFDASRLGRLLGRHADSAGLTSTIFIFTLVAVFGLLILAGYTFMYRRTIAGVSALKAGAEVVGSGNLDYRMPEERRDEIGDLSRAFNKMTADLKSMGGLYQSQLQISSWLQQSLLDVPNENSAIDFGHLYRSATLEAAVGGDFYDVFGVAGGRVALLIGDVSGHGVEAARIATLVKDVVYAYSRTSHMPSAIIAGTNDLLIGKRTRGFVTLFLGVLDPSSGLLTYCSAGHPNALVRSLAGNLRYLEAASSPMGIFPGKTWQDSEALLGEQDLLFLYTDGVIEVRKNGAFFGQDGLAEVIMASEDPSPGQLPREVLSAVLAYADGVLGDDVALLAVRLAEGSSPPRQVLQY